MKDVLDINNAPVSDFKVYICPEKFFGQQGNIKLY
jgi:hypothetical protein